MKKQSIAIIGVIAFVLAVAVGYALFSETLTIKGTAKASGSFDYAFTKVGPIQDSDGYTDQNKTPLFVLKTAEDGTTVNIAEDGTAENNTGNWLEITVDKLDYPGAFVEIPVTVKNVGTIKGKLLSIDQEGIDADNENIKVTYTGIAASEAVVAPGESNNMVIKVEWLDSHELAEGVNEFEDEVSFRIALNYQQVNE